MFTDEDFPLASISRIGDSRNVSQIWKTNRFSIPPQSNTNSGGNALNAAASTEQAPCSVPQGEGDGAMCRRGAQGRGGAEQLDTRGDRAEQQGQGGGDADACTGGVTLAAPVFSSAGPDPPHNR